MSQDLEQLLHEGQQAMESGAFPRAAEHFAAAWRLSGSLWGLAPLAGNAWRLAKDRIARRRFWQEVYAGPPPEAPEDRFTLGTELLDAAAPDLAVACFMSVVSDRPKDPAAWSALASARRAAGDLDAAWDAVEVALALNPTNGTFLLTAGQIRHCQGQLGEALSWIRQARIARPDHAPTRMQAGMTALLAGDWTHGFAEFEFRQRPATLPPVPEWLGGTLSGTILVTAEQGLGDLLQFIRYVPLLAERGANRVIVECPSSMTRLLEANGFEPSLTGQRPATDWQVPILSLPHRLGLGAATPRPSPSYISADGAAGSHSKDGAPLRIGLAWRGNPDFPETFLRDFDPALLSSLIDLPGVAWTSLQFGEALLGSASSNDSLFAPTDWLETARHLSQLNAVVTVDTSIAHLAGSMGIPVLIMLPYSPDWRWGLNSTISVWYPSAYLARQPRPRDWAGVIPLVHDWIRRL